MQFFVFIRDYLVWHYGDSIRDFLTLIHDSLWFGYHFFSLPTLTKTLFSPFARIHTEGFSITEIETSLQNLTANIISRAVGFVLRIIVISVGAITEILLAIALATAFICWLALPFIILSLLTFSAGFL